MRRKKREGSNGEQGSTGDVVVLESDITINAKAQTQTILKT